MGLEKVYTLSVFLLLFYSVSAVRVCNTQLDYYNYFSTQCHDNPDGDALPKDILGRWGCTVKEYQLTTADGYQFSVISCSKNEDPAKNPALFVHGIYMNCRAFLSSKEKSLAYQLVNNGTRVFFINVRGTIYSQGNVNGLSPTAYPYWNFSWHHMGVNEVPQTLDLIYTETGKKSLVVGYSMGSTATAVFLSLFPAQAASRVTGFVAMAPVVILNTGIPSILGKIAPLWPLVQPFVRAYYKGKLMGRNPTQYAFCASLPITMQLCYSAVTLMYGINYGGLDYPVRPVSIWNTPDSVSENVVTHYTQLINSGKFQQYDYGASGNQIAYGSATPPLYPLQNITIPTTLVVGENDWLATKTNAQTLWNTLPAASRCKFITVSDPTFSHDAFLNNKYQLPLLNQPLVSVINNMNAGNCA